MQISRCFTGVFSDHGEPRRIANANNFAPGNRRVGPAEACVCMKSFTAVCGDDISRYCVAWTQMQLDEY